MEKYNWKHILGFVVPSLAGILLFMVPVEVDGSWTVIVKVIADLIGDSMVDFLPLLCCLIVTVSAVLGIASLFHPKFIDEHPLMYNTFSASPAWIIIRVVGAVFAWIAFAGVMVGDGEPLQIIGGEDTGGFVLGDLLTVLVIIFFLAGLLLPLLLDFGLLEFIGALLTKVMRPLFKIPGRAAVDCVTSWIGDGTLGVMLTCNQYESGYYSSREAAIISTAFSAVSITFSIVVLAQVDLMEYFGPYYLLICLVGIVCALIVPRIPPLSLKKDTYLVEGKAMPETLPEGYTSSAKFGLDLAIKRVESHRGIGQFLENGIKNAANMWFGVLPVVMCVGTLALMLANYTTIFDVLGTPFMPLLELLQVPEAQEVSKTMIVGHRGGGHRRSHEPLHRGNGFGNAAHLPFRGWRPYPGFEDPCERRGAVHPLPGAHHHQLDHRVPGSPPSVLSRSTLPANAPWLMPWGVFRFPETEHEKKCVAKFKAALPLPPKATPSKRKSATIREHVHIAL